MVDGGELLCERGKKRTRREMNDGWCFVKLKRGVRGCVFAWEVVCKFIRDLGHSHTYISTWCKTLTFVYFFFFFFYFSCHTVRPNLRLSSPLLLLPYPTPSAFHLTHPPPYYFTLILLHLSLSLSRLSLYTSPLYSPSPSSNPLPPLSSSTPSFSVYA